MAHLEDEPEALNDGSYAIQMERNNAPDLPNNHILERNALERLFDPSPREQSQPKEDQPLSAPSLSPTKDQGHNYEVPTCSICLSELTQDLGVISCGHVFHTECIASSLSKTSSTCPLCRKPATKLLSKKVLMDQAHNSRSQSQRRPRNYAERVFAQNGGHLGPRIPSLPETSEEDSLSARSLTSYLGQPLAPGESIPIDPAQRQKVLPLLYKALPKKDPFKLSLPFLQNLSGEHKEAAETLVKKQSELMEKVQLKDSEIEQLENKVKEEVGQKRLLQVALEEVKSKSCSNEKELALLKAFTEKEKEKSDQITRNAQKIYEQNLLLQQAVKDLRDAFEKEGMSPEMAASLTDMRQNLPAAQQAEQFYKWCWRLERQTSALERDNGMLLERIDELNENHSRKLQKQQQESEKEIRRLRKLLNKNIPFPKIHSQEEGEVRELKSLPKDIHIKKNYHLKKNNESVENSLEMLDLLEFESDMFKSKETLSKNSQKIVKDRKDLMREEILEKLRKEREKPQATLRGSEPKNNSTNNSFFEEVIKQYDSNNLKF